MAPPAGAESMQPRLRGGLGWQPVAYGGARVPG